MPFTPFHLGPGLAFKSVGGDRFSFVVFGGAQVLMDIEPGVRLLLGHQYVHGPTHTLVGAALIGAVAMGLGKPIGEWFLRLIREPAEISWQAAAAGAFIGTFSHVLLDGIMHPDVALLWPYSGWSWFFNLISFHELHLLCIALGVLGGIGYLIRRVVAERKPGRRIRPDLPKS